MSTSRKTRNHPNISVIAPNYNDARYLRTFLESLCHQTHRDFEIIIVDGFSTDKSSDILEQYRNRLNLRVIYDKRRNIGLIRTVGGWFAKGAIQVHTSSDTYLEPMLLKKLSTYYQQHPSVISIAGRTYPLGTSLFAHIGYQLFDFLRYVFTTLPMPVKKYRPSGNFTSVRSNVFTMVKGYPPVAVNEDGLFGQKLDQFAAKNYKSVVFHLGLYVGHHVKKFEQMGGLKAILFYFYTLGNLFPLLQPLLKPIEYRAQRLFEGQPCQTESFIDILKRCWNWL